MCRAAGWIILVCLSCSPGAAAGQEPAASSPPTGQESPAEDPPPPISPDPATGLDAPLTPSPEQGEASPQTELESSPQTELTVGLGTRLAAGIGLSHPLGPVLRLQILHGLSADVREDDGTVRAVCAVPISHCAQGFLVEAEAGSGGGKLSLGLGARARVEEDDFRGNLGIGLRASLARTWGSPFRTEPGLTYVGPELDLMLLRIQLTLGVMWRVSGSAGASALVTWEVGVGL